MKSISNFIVAMTLVVLTSSAFAQSVTVSSVTAQAGGSVDLSIPFVASQAAGREVETISFVVSFDAASFSSVTVPADCGTDPGVGSGLSKTCQAGPGAVQVTVAGGVALNSGNVATITFNVDGAATPATIAVDMIPATINIGTSAGPLDPPATTVNGQVEILDGPQAVFGSNPTPAAGVTMAGMVSNIIAADVIVNNDNGDAGSTLTYSCAETADVDNVFTLAGDITNHPVAVGSTGTVSVACDSGTIGSYTGAMECTHNGASSPDTFALSCTVNAGPEPAFSAVSDVALVAAQEGDADPTGSVTITNTGDTGTTLTGTCSLTGPDAQITMSGGAFSVAQGAAGAVVGLSCNAAAEGDYTNSLSCAHNGTNVATPQVFPVTCSVGPAGGAIYLSAPALGSTIEMTPTDVPAGATVPDQTLTINNAATDPADNDLILSACAYTGDAAITVGAAPSSPIAPNGMSSTTFSCDTTTVGDYNGTYSCGYSVDGGTTTLTASYPVHCGVRAAGSELSYAPMPGVINMHAPMNGTTFSTINVSEILDEGVDGSVDSCSLADGTNFAIITTFPLTVAAGGSALIEVSGTDPMDGTFGDTDVLTCIGTDTVNGTVTNVWDLNLTVQTAAIPTLSTWGLLAMFLTMLSLGGIMIRRKESS